MRRLLAALAVAAVGLPLPAHAGAPTATLEAASARVVKILDDPALAGEDRARDRQAAVLAAVVDIFDFAEVSRRALGRHWRSLTPAQRDDFIALFRALLERTYLPRLNLYQGERVNFIGENLDGDFATVNAKFLMKQGPEVPVSFRLRQAGERWLVYDVAVEGISLVSNYRAQFDQVVQKGSVDALFQRLRERLASEEPLPAPVLPRSR